MSAESEVLQPKTAPTSLNPWKFVPLLYVLQAIPGVVVQDLAAIFFQDLGISEGLILTWTSVIVLPWSLQFLLGPLVDLSAKKRKWILMGQIVLTICLTIAPFLLLQGAAAFQASLIFLAAMAFVSAMTNIATDGFYLLACSRDVQAKFVGVQTAFFKVGKLICISLVPFIVGNLMQFNNVKVETGGNLYFAIKGSGDKELRYIKQADFHLEQGELVTSKKEKLLDTQGKPIAIPGVENTFNIQNGKVEIGKDSVPIALYQMGKVISDNPNDSSAKLTSFPTKDSRDTFRGSQATRKVSAPYAWFIALLSVAIIYLIFMLPTFKLVPEAEQDVDPTPEQKGQFVANLARTMGILAFYGSAYFALSSAWKVGANLLTNLNPKGLAGWVLTDKVKFLGYQTELSGVAAEAIQFATCLPIAAALWIYLRKSLKGSEMGETFSSFFRQSGIVPILFFMTFYRFSEAMVSSASKVFLKADLDKGGLALNNIQFGLIKGTIGMLGILAGGIVGGILAGKIGLKKGFWIIAILMHLPILFYVFASFAQPSNMIVIAVIEFVDQFGYGIGLSAYFVYLMSVAQRGNHRTAHYAIGSGLGSTFIALAGITGGVILTATSYKIVFLSAVLFAIPGLLTLRFIPHDDEIHNSSS